MLERGRRRPTWWSWRPRWPTSGRRRAADTKLPKADGLPELVLEPTPDILAELGPAPAPGPGPGRVRGRDRRRGRPRAGAKLEAKGVDLMVANDVSAPGVGFDHDTNAVTILGSRRHVPARWPLTSKIAGGRRRSG